MNDANTPGYLRRYTDLPALFHLLGQQCLTLLDPKTWDDRNDAFFMSVYKEKKAWKTVLALCFSQAPETYHHWRVFSSGPAGVCLVFDRAQLLQDLQAHPGVRCAPMAYLTLPAARSRTLCVDELPFLKRMGYQPEKEFRAVFASAHEVGPSLRLPIRLSTIRSISLSPWMHASLSESTVKAIRAIEGCARLRVSRSTLLSNEQWKKHGSAAQEAQAAGRVS
jgi:hypothetical protein